MAYKFAELSRRAMVLAVMSACLPCISADADDPPLDEWIHGPVRYIATKQEAKQFRALKDDNARALFIEEFWHRRDPTPETLNNEYRQLFWERVQEANRIMYGSTREGWRTDRGKIYILYGAPSEIQQDPNFRSDSIAASHGIIRWIYEGRPEQRRDLDAITVVTFLRDTTGEYRVTYDPELTSIFFNIRDWMKERPYESLLRELAVPRRSELSVMLDLGRLQEVPPQEQVLLERIETRELYQSFPLRVAVHRFAEPGGDDTLAVVTVDLSALDLRGSPAILARFTPRDVTRAPRIIGEGTFRVEELGGGVFAQGRIVLEPGRYDLLALTADPLGAGTGIYRGVVEIPAREGGLHLSDAVLAASLEPVRFGSLASYREPFVLGPYRFCPRVERRLARGDVVDVLIEVYGGEPPYAVSYQLQGREDDGSWVDLGPAQSERGDARTRAWGMPTTPAWPDGDYRVRIRVQDGKGTVQEELVPFTLGGSASE